MGFEKPDKNPYEPLKMVDGKLVKESELTEYEASLHDHVDEEEDDEYLVEDTELEEKPKGVSRRTFLKGLGGAAAAYALHRTGVFDDIDLEDIGEKAKDTLEWFEGTIEAGAETRTPIEQLLEEGKIQDLVAGIEEIRQRHFEHLTQTETGRTDMKIATDNLKALGLKKFAQPFVDRRFKPGLCYMIAIQETRGRNIVSATNDHGIMGINIETLKDMGYSEEQARDPQTASEIAAKYCHEERRRFGNQGDMILHAYNGGGGLFGFSDGRPKSERTTENFYAYMEQYFNERISRYERDGYFEYRIEDGDGLYKIQKRFDVAFDELLVFNGLHEDSILRVGASLKIPFERSEEGLRRAFGPELRALQYTPEVKAKYQAVSVLGFLA